MFFLSQLLFRSIAMCQSDYRVIFKIKMIAQNTLQQQSANSHCVHDTVGVWKLEIQLNVKDIDRGLIATVKQAIWDIIQNNIMQMVYFLTVALLALECNQNKLHPKKNLKL